jgi:predicted amidohydrolase
VRVALVQLEPGGKGGAANLQSLMTAIDKASSGDPEPDLLVLPSGCDFGGHRVTSGVAGRFSTFSETVAWKARDWGLYIAVGLHTQGTPKSRPSTFLYDPDGDVALCTCRGRGDTMPETNHAAAWLASPVGWIGILDPGAASLALWEDSIPREGGFLACPLFMPRSGSNGAVLTQWRSGRAAAHGVYCGVAGWAKETNNPQQTENACTMVCAPDGTLIQSASEPTEAIVYAEIDLKPASDGAVAKFGPSDRQTD